MLFQLSLVNIKKDYLYLNLKEFYIMVPKMFFIVLKMSNPYIIFINERNF